MAADNSTETELQEIVHTPKSDVPLGIHKPKSPEKLECEERVVRFCGSPDHKHMILAMKEEYEKKIVTEETCLRFQQGKCKKQHPHHLVFYHPLIQGENWLEKWRKDE